jgi:putative flavoprotein involved in K+ transport
MVAKRGLNPLVVDRGERVAPSWRARYDGFRLNTSSWFSYLPGRRFPREAGRWPSRDSIVAYYDAYAHAHDLELQLGTTVERIDRDGDGWALATSAGPMRARHVVVATGKYNAPVTPRWPGWERFTGEIVHSATYRNAGPYCDKRVLVVGAGASGFEIATQVARGGAAATWLSIRTPPHLIHRDIGPFPSDLFAVLARRLPIRVVDSVGHAIRKVSIGDLSKYGLEAPADGIATRVATTGMIPTVDGPYVDALKEALFRVVAAVDRMEGDEVVLADGTRVAPDAVITATGYKRNLEPLVGHLGVLTDDGHPAVNGARAHPSARGLYFIGFSEPLSGNLRQLRLDARNIARAIGEGHSK